MKQRVDFIQTIRQKLITRKIEVETQLINQSHEKMSDGVVQDSADEVLSLSMEKVQNSLQKAELDEIRFIQDALERIDAHEYGTCIDCAEHISERRLEHSPYAARCIVCQERFEG